WRDLLSLHIPVADLQGGAYPKLCRPACPGAPWERSREPALSEVERGPVVRLSLKQLPITLSIHLHRCQGGPLLLALSSRAKPRDLWCAFPSNNSLQPVHPPPPMPGWTTAFNFVIPSVAEGSAVLFPHPRSLLQVNFDRCPKLLTRSVGS